MAQVQIRLDRSRPFSTCHGERTPDDPSVRVHFWQGGNLGQIRVVLPFDVHGNLVPDDGSTAVRQGKDAEGKPISYPPLYDENMRKYLAAKVKKAQAQASVPAAEQIKEDGEGDEDEGNVEASDDDVNLEAWLRGQIEYPAHKIRDSFAKRYHHRTGSIREIVTELVLDLNVVPEDQVCEARRKYLPAAAAQPGPAAQAAA